MAEHIDIHLSQLRFPSTCVVCTASATTSYDLQKKLFFKRKSCTVKVDVPMCDLHARSARRARIVETWALRLGLISGAVTGLFAATLLLGRSLEVEGTQLFLWLAGGLGFGAVLAFWATIALCLTSFIAPSVSTQAHHAVRLTRYWPQEQFIRLEFQSEQLADSVQNTHQNLPRKRTLRVKLKPGTPRF